MADTEKALMDLEPCRGVPFQQGKTRRGSQGVTLDVKAAKNVMACIERGQMFEERFANLEEVKVKIPTGWGYKAMYVERR